MTLPALAAMAAVALLTLPTLPALAALAAVDAVAVLTARWSIARAMIDRRHLRRLPMFDDRGLRSSGPSGLDLRHVQGFDVRHVHFLDDRDVQGLDLRHVHGLDVRHVQGLDVRDAHQVFAALAAASLYACACANDFCRGPRPDRRGPMVAVQHVPVAAPSATTASPPRQSSRKPCRLPSHPVCGPQRHSHGAMGRECSSGCAGRGRTNLCSH